MKQILPGKPAKPSFEDDGNFIFLNEGSDIGCPENISCLKLNVFRGRSKQNEGEDREGWNAMLSLNLLLQFYEVSRYGLHISE